MDSILLYASETWTLLASDMKAIESFHMKCQQFNKKRPAHAYAREQHDLTINTALIYNICKNQQTL